MNRVLTPRAQVASSFLHVPGIPQFTSPYNYSINRFLRNVRELKKECRRLVRLSSMREKLKHTKKKKNYYRKHKVKRRKRNCRISNCGHFFTGDAGIYMELILTGGKYRDFSVLYLLRPGRQACGAERRHA